MDQFLISRQSLVVSQNDPPSAAVFSPCDFAEDWRPKTDDYSLFYIVRFLTPSSRCWQKHNGRTKPLRVIAGQYRSRPLRSLPGADIRPTADRLRETLFNVLAGGNPDALVGSSWADLYAGTGAVGIEALSRGAAHVYFVESSRAAANLIQRNLASLHIDTGFDLLHSEAQHALRDLEKKNAWINYVFLDPPYRLEAEYEKTLNLLGHSGLLTDNSTVIAEHSKKFELLEAAGSLKRYRKLVQGDATLSFYSTKT